MKKSRTGQRPKKVFSCKDKNAYTAEEAAVALKHALSLGSANVSMYSCKHCDMYHIGHDNRKNWKKT